MAYYTKQEVLDYVNENMEVIEEKGLKALNTKPEVVKRLNDEDDMVGFFWIDYEDGENNGNKIKFEGKSWYKIDTDIYTDDRFAIDLFQAMESDLTISDVIRKRQQEKNIAKKGIGDIKKLEEKVKENIKKDGAK